ncbi:amidohydrolase [Mycobacterium eburneum]|nr:amidohydrolase family protein [Mycobacterium eburneum]TDH47997.1 amidohydrolase [Mycobacterium eburneum]
MSSIETPKVIGLEEHFVTAPVLAAWEALEPRWQDLSLVPSREGATGHLLADLGSDRRAAMADAGVDVQVLSLSTPGVQNLAPGQAVTLQTEINDALAQWIQSSPDHFQGFATLATPAPERAAEELRRAVTTLGLDGAMLFGRTRERNLDHLDNWAIFEAAEELNAPLYLHPQSPPPAVRAAYYDGFNPMANAAFATHGLGWHYETGVQLLRMILAGVFDRFPELRVIAGHWGEMLLFYLDRIDQLVGPAELSCKPSEYFRTNVFVTPSGILSQRYLRWAIDVLGVDRILFAADYPFVPLSSGGARSFLADSDLGVADGNLVASGNWERLRAQIRR